MPGDFEVLSQQITDLKETIEQRFGALEKKIDDDRDNCQKLCVTMIGHAQEKATEAHERLSEQAKDIKDMGKRIDKVSNWQYKAAGVLLVVSLLAAIILPKLIDKVW